MTLKYIRPVLWVCLCAYLLSGCSLSEPTEVRTLFGYTMGTSYTVKLVATETEANQLDGDIRSALDRVDDAMSTYSPRSELSRFNDAPVGEWVALSPVTYQVIDMALAVADTSDGAFDPTVGPLVDMWGFGPKLKTDQVPAEEQVAEKLGQIGWEAIELDDDDHRVRKTAPRELDLSAIAKGYAVDRVADRIESAGFTDYLVEVGGELRFSGTKPHGKPWRVAIETPSSAERSAYRILEVERGAMATSGDYRNFFEEDGVRYSHTLDPKTGYPISHDLVSVTVLGEQSAMADAYATAFLVLGTQPALALANKLDLSVYLLQKDGQGYRSYKSERFKRLFDADSASQSDT